MTAQNWKNNVLSYFRDGSGKRDAISLRPALLVCRSGRQVRFLR